MLTSMTLLLIMVVTKLSLELYTYIRGTIQFTMSSIVKYKIMIVLVIFSRFEFYNLALGLADEMNRWDEELIEGKTEKLRNMGRDFAATGNLYLYALYLQILDLKARNLQ